MEGQSAYDNERGITIKLGKFVFIPDKRLLSSDNQSVLLTKKESALLTLFCNSANQLLPRNYALMNVWGNESYFNGRSMDVFIARLRKYLRKDSDISIVNVYGKGFIMSVPNIETITEGQGQEYPEKGGTGVNAGQASDA